MRKLFLVGLLVALAGCKSVVHPFDKKAERADDPLLSTEEQHRKARYLLAFPDDELGPRSGGERPPLGPHGQ